MTDVQELIIDHFSSEGLRYATEKLPPPIKEALLQQRRQRQKSSR